MAAKKKAVLDPATLPEPKTGDREPGQDRLALKKKVRYFYDLQRLRLQVGGRLTKRPEGSTIDLHTYDVALLEKRMEELRGVERTALGDVEAHLKTIPFYRDVLSDKSRFKGVGPTMAGVILSEFDIHRQENVSQMWSFAGLAPVAARRCKQCSTLVERAGKDLDTSVDLSEVGSGAFKHVKPFVARAKPGEETPKEDRSCPYAKELIGIDQTFESGKAMRPTKGEKLPYNAFLKTKLVGVLGPVLLQVGSPWRKCYDDYKHRKGSGGWGRSDAHRHQAAIRYMVKMLLLAIWKEWRAFEGLSVREPYSEGKLGMKPHGGGLENTTQRDDVPEIDPEVMAEVELLAGIVEKPVA